MSKCQTVRKFYHCTGKRAARVLRYTTAAVLMSHLRMRGVSPHWYPARAPVLAFPCTVASTKLPQGLPGLISYLFYKPPRRDMAIWITGSSARTTSQSPANFSHVFVNFSQCRSLLLISNNLSLIRLPTSSRRQNTSSDTLTHKLQALGRTARVFVHPISQNYQLFSSSSTLNNDAAISGDVNGRFLTPSPRCRHWQRQKLSLPEYHSLIPSLLFCMKPFHVH